MKPVETWNMLRMGLRLGGRPQALVTTTPVADLPLLATIRDARDTVTSGGTTFENFSLTPDFMAAMHETYGETRLARQELYGEIVGQAEGALWTREMMDGRRCDMPGEGELVRVVIGVDPPAGVGGDLCGISVCGLRTSGEGVVLADLSVGGERPEGWARAVANAFKQWGADLVVAETNNGGAMVDSVLKTVAPGLAVKRVHASRGKAARAEPVAAAFEAGRCRFAGQFAELEDQLSRFTPGGYSGSGSPDRADAMVWALTELVVRAPAQPRLRGT